jgi:hypothetical protein
VSHRTEIADRERSPGPYSGSSLVPMLVAGLVLTLFGMIAALALS